MDIDIRPQDVNISAKMISYAVETTKDRVAKALTPSTAAANANEGWQCSPTLVDCAITWKDHLTDLAQRTQDAAQNLHGSAGDYQMVEKRIVEGLTGECFDPRFFS